MPFVKRPGRYGLYDPSYEKENCGVGFLANIKGKRSHSIIEDAGHILCRMDHRGARGAEVNTGDGAGILTALPHEFLVKVAKKDASINLPASGSYAAGIVFLPKKDADRAACKKAVEKIVAAHGQNLLGWRRVPTNNAGLGPSAIASEPVMEMLFVGASSDAAKSPEAFDRKLFVIRKEATHKIRGKDSDPDCFFYVSSLSCRVMVYKLSLIHISEPTRR